MIYFGTEVATCRIGGKESDTFYKRFNLKKRPYLGPTSTDHELAFLMAN
jgi:tRNA G10  N-methylase Trm11